MSIPPLTRTSEPFRYHERVVGDVWLKRADEPAATPEGPHVYTQRAAWLNAWITAIGSAQTTVHLSLPTLTHAALVAALAQAAKQRQVRVYIITTEGQGPELKPDEKKVHLAALDFLATSGATLQSTTTFHPALLLIDAASAQPRAFLESGEGLCVDEPTQAPNLQRLFAAVRALRFRGFDGRSFGNHIVDWVGMPAAKRSELGLKAACRVAQELDWPILARKAVDFTERIHQHPPGPLVRRERKRRFL